MQRVYKYFPTAALVRKFVTVISKYFVNYQCASELQNQRYVQIMPGVEIFFLSFWIWSILIRLGFFFSDWNSSLGYLQIMSRKKPWYAHPPGAIRHFFHLMLTAASVLTTVL